MIHTLPLSISPQALEAIRLIMATKKIGEPYKLRIGMKGAGCSGQFFLGFDTTKSTDLVFEYEGIGILIDKHQLIYCFEQSIEYQTDESGKSGFIFKKNQPNSIDI
jgi:iron-sulfur cluster assembly protein